MSDPRSPEPTTPEPTTPTSETPPASTPVVEEAKPETPTSLLGAEPAKEAPPAFDPETIKLPEGITKDDALFGEFTNVAKEHGLSGPAAQQLIELAAKQTKLANERLLSDWNKQQETWQAEIKADKDIGGDSFEAVLQTFSRVANNAELSDPKFREALASTGAGNHPAIVKTLARWAAALSEGGPVRGGPAANGRGAPETIGQAIYGPNGPHVGGPRLSIRI